MDSMWLEFDGRRTCMGRVGRFMIQVAVSGDNYGAGIFLMGERDPNHERIIDLAMDVEDGLSIHWSSGALVAVGSVAPAFVRASRKAGCIHLHWRDKEDRTIQQATFAESNDRPIICQSIRRVFWVGEKCDGQGPWNVGRHPEEQRRAGSR